MINQLYPFSTKDGGVIPLEIIRPSGVMRKSFITGAASASDSLVALVPIIMLEATQDCFVRFGAIAAVVPVSGTPSTIITDQIYVPAGRTVVCSPKSPNFTVIADTVAGVLTIQLIEQWAGLGHEISFKAI